MSANPLNTYVYCIQERGRDAGPIKIGVAINPRQRLDNLQVGNPVQLMLYGLIGPLTKLNAERLECELHTAMSKHRIRGEWFTERAVAIFDEVQGQHGVAVPIKASLHIA